MAVTSSLPLITIFLFLSILAGHSVRDFPKINNIQDINVSAVSLGKFVPVATLYLNGESSWKSSCYKHNTGSLKFNGDKTMAIIDIEASDPTTTNSSCSDNYEIRVSTTIILRSSVSAGGAPSISYSISFSSEGFVADIEYYGVSIYIYDGNGVEPRNQMKESGIHIVKQVEETLKTF